ncbi:hypothetical protein BC829DRAFT_379301 [Chytridium lagenaria]|nr:hypothetical protein BC829DRAFT_379301 [Chytridium lagenaria]
MSFTLDDLALAWPVWKDGVNALRASWLMSFIHAVYIGYAYRKMAPVSEQVGPRSFLRGLFSTLLIGMGGGTIAAIISGKPVGWLLYNDYLPTYILGYLLVNQDPTDAIYTLLNTLQPLTDLIFDLVDSIVRGFALAWSIDQFRNSDAPNAQTSFVGQFVIGVITITGGGITWKWLKGGAFMYPGWDFSVIMGLAATYIFNTATKECREVMEGYVNTVMIPMSPQEMFVGYVREVVVPKLKMAGGVLGVPGVLSGEDWRYLLSALLLAGFLMRPVVRWLAAERKVAGPVVVEKESETKKDK